MPIPRPIVLPENPDTLAPDMSEIRLLPTVIGGGMVHCTLPAGAVSLAHAHNTIEEIWFFLEGEGEVWRKQDEEERVDAAYPGVGLTIPTGTHFQFRNTGAGPLRFLIATTPPWPGAHEAYRVTDHWPTN